MIEPTEAFLAGQHIETSAAEHMECVFELQTVSITVDLPSEFQALLSGLCSDGGRDTEGNITRIWKITGIQSIDFAQIESGKTIVFNLKPGYEITDVSSQLSDWLIDLRLRRQNTERSLASSALR